LQKVRNQLTQGRRTSIGQTASFNGLGGLGKTQLAVEYAWEYRNEYPNGVIWIEADQEIDAQLTALAVNARWAAEASEHRYKLDVARKRLQSFSNCLIIFDNVERRAAIERYLPEPGASPHLLITSREPQPGFEPVPLAPLDENQSVYMLIQEAGRDPKTAEETIAAQEIAKRLDGLPLAIEIAGAYLHEMPTVTFDEFRRLLSRDPQIQMARNLLSSFTRHEADLAATLRISDRAFKQEPLLESILDLLTWSGAGAMGHALMSYVLGVDQLDLVAPLAFGARLHLLKEELTSAGPCTDHRYRIHRLVRDVRRANTPITNRGDWVAGISARIGEWFEQRRQDFAHLAQYELEFDHLRTWQGNASNIGDASAARLLWLEAYPAWHRGNYRESLRLLESAVGRLNSLGGMPELYAHLLNDLGAVWHLLGDNKLSLEYHEKSLSKRRELSGDLHADTAMSYDNLGSALSRAGDYQRALEFAEKGLSIRRELLGEEHPDTAHSYSNVGQVYHRLGDHRRSLEYAEKSLSIERKIRGEKHPETAHGYSNAGTAYDALGDHRRALEYKKKSLSINIELLGNKHPVMASVYSAIAGTYSYLDDHSRSLDYAQKSLSLRREQLGEEHPDTATSYNHLGTVYGNLGDHRRALKLHQAGLKIAIAILGPTHPDTIKILIDAAITQEKDGHSSESFKLIQHAARSLPEGHPMLHRLRDVKRQLIKKHPLLRSLSSGHPPPKPRNRKKK
jgi:tetratricopeptide (TPR) repeat protein